MSLTARRKRSFCHDLLASARASIGLADVGAGGALKEPWNVFDDRDLRIHGFEPTAGNGGADPICVSDRPGRREFYVAADERGSSLHRPHPGFVERFGQQSLLPARAIEVSCVTLDDHFGGRYADIDAMDINVEGHDLQALRGAGAMLRAGELKLIKVEFEVTEVWIGQGWFADIDALLRGHRLDLVSVDVQWSRPANVRHIFHRGEPLWGKALYAPALDAWRERLAARRNVDPERAERDVVKAVALYVAADAPGRAFDLLEAAQSAGTLRNLDAAERKRQVEQVFRWAKLETGLAALARLAGATARSLPGAARP